MGECGCGNNWPQLKFRGPDGGWYGIALHSGCDDCHIDAGIEIVVMMPGAYSERDLESIPEVPFLMGDRDRLQVALISRSDLEAKLLAGVAGLQAEEEYDTAGAIQDALPEALKEAIWSTFEAWATKTRKIYEERKKRRLSNE